MNKKGSNKNGTMLVVFGVALILILGGISYKLFYAQDVISSNSGVVSNGGSSSGGVNNIVTSSTTMSLSGYDAQATGTAVGITSYTGVNGQPLSTGVTSVAQGQSLNLLLVNNTQYHNGFVALSVPATTNLIKATPMNKNASLTIAVYNTAKTAMTNGGGATNQSVSTGSAPTMELDLTGTSLASTQDMICILEGSDNTKINNLVLNGFGATFIGTAKPSAYTLGATTSSVWVYKVPAISDASLRVGSIYAESKSGQSMAGKYFKFTCLTQEYFIDGNANANTVNPYATKVGEPNVYYGTEDSQGTAKNMATYSFTGYFT